MALEQDLQNFVVRRLRTKNAYEDFITNLPYHIERGGIHYLGELDIYARRKSGRVVYAEIKHSDNSKNWKKARQQILRYAAANPGRTITGLYVTPTCIRRYRPSKESIEIFKYHYASG